MPLHSKIYLHPCISHRSSGCLHSTTTLASISAASVVHQSGVCRPGESFYGDLRQELFGSALFLFRAGVCDCFRERLRDGEQNGMLWIMNERNRYTDGVGNHLFLGGNA